MDLYWKEEVLRHAIRMFPITERPEEVPILIMLIKEYENIKNVIGGIYDDYSFHRDLAEAYLLIGELELALEHAIACNKLCTLEIKNRNDIIAKIKFLENDILGGLKAINEYYFIGKHRTLDLVKYLIEYYKDNIDIQYLKNNFSSIFNYIEKYFGNWETANIKATGHQISTFPTSFIKLRDQSYYDYRLKEIISDAEKSFNNLIIKNESIRKIYDLINKKEYKTALQEINNSYKSNDFSILELKAKILYSMKEYDEIINMKLLRKTYFGKEYFIKANLIRGLTLTPDDIFWLSIYNIQLDSKAVENYYPVIIKIIEKRIKEFELTKNVSINNYLSVIINDNNFFNMWNQLSINLLNNIKEEIRNEIGEDVKWIKEYMLYKKIEDSFKDYNIVRHVRPVWLSPQHLDIFIPQLSLAVEYNGEQHYHPVEYFGGTESFIYSLERDARKRTLCEINKVSLEIVKYDQELDEVIKMLEKKYLWNNIPKGC